MPETSMGLPYPASTDAPDIPADIQALADATNTVLNLPDDVTATVATVLSITSTTYAALPTPLQAAITNPSSDLDMLVDIKYGAYMASSAAGVELSGSIAATGGMTFAAGSVGAGGAIANSENLLVAGIITAVSCVASISVVIPAGAAAVTFAVQAKRSAASGSQIFNFPHLRIQPRRFLVP